MDPCARRRRPLNSACRSQPSPALSSPFQAQFSPRLSLGKTSYPPPPHGLRQTDIQSITVDITYRYTMQPSTPGRPSVELLYSAQIYQSAIYTSAQCGVGRPIQRAAFGPDAHTIPYYGWQIIWLCKGQPSLLSIWGGKGDGGGRDSKETPRNRQKLPSANSSPITSPLQYTSRMSCLVLVPSPSIHILC